MNGFIVKSFFKILAKIQIRYRFFILFFIMLASVLGMLGLPKVQILSDDQNLIAQSKEHTKSIAEFEETFGNSENIVILVEADDVFNSEVLRAIKNVGNELLEKVPQAQSIMSITDIDITLGTEDGMQIIHPFEENIPESEAEIEYMRSLILSRKSLANKLVSSDCKEAWVILSLTPFPKETEKTGRRMLSPMYKAGQAAIDVITDVKWQSDKYTFKAAGTPYTEMEERVVVKEETTRTVLVSFSIMVLLLIIFTMSFIGTLIPVLSLVLGISVVFGFMGHLGIVADSNMVSIPILLAMALSVGYSIHLINSFKQYFYISGKRKEAVVKSIEETGWPLFFTVITTIVSVLSFLTTSLYPLRWLGCACGATVLSVYIYTATIIPIIMSFGKDKEATQLAQKKEAKLFNFLDEKFVKFGSFVLRQRVHVLAISLLIFLVCLMGIFRVQIKMDGYSFMGLRIPYIKRIDHIANSKLGSYFNYNVLLQFEEIDSLKEPRNLKKIEELEEFIATFKYTKKTNNEPKIFSLLSVIKEMRQTLHEDNESFYNLPENKDELIEMLFLYEISGGNLSQWIDDDYMKTRLRVEVSKFDSEELNKNVEQIKEKVKELFPNINVALIGEGIDFASINNYIVDGELSSMAFSLLAIFVLMWLVFGNLKLALIGMVPNIAPLLVIGAVMGYFGIYLDMITMTIMPMLLGISVDDTIYFICHAKEEYIRCGTYSCSVEGTFRNIGKTLLATSIILMIGFATNAVSNLTGIVKIGLLGSLGFFVALVADYFITPVLLYMFKAFKRK